MRMQSFVGMEVMSAHVRVAPRDFIGWVVTSKAGQSGKVVDVVLFSDLSIGEQISEKWLAAIDTAHGRVVDDWARDGDVWSFGKWRPIVGPSAASDPMCSACGASAYVGLLGRDHVCPEPEIVVSMDWWNGVAYPSYSTRHRERIYRAGFGNSYFEHPTRDGAIDGLRKMLGLK